MGKPAVNSYSEGIRSAFEGEIIGERLYRLLATRHPDRRRRATLAAIADIEHCTHRALEPIATRLAIEPCSQKLQLTVERRARELDALSWDEFIQKAVVDWPPYIAEFEALRGLAPEGDEPALLLLVRHEQVLVEFARSEQSGDRSNTSMLRLKRFVEDCHR